MQPLPFKENAHSPFIKYVLSTYRGPALGQTPDSGVKALPIFAELWVYY